MRQYEITNRATGEIVGRFAGERASAAIDALVRACGYASHDRLVEDNHGEFGDLSVTEIA